MAVYLYRWPDGSTSLTVARSKRAAAVVFDRLGPVQVRDVIAVPTPPAPGAGLLLHVALDDDGALRIDPSPGDRGIVVRGRPVPVQDVATIKALAYPLVHAIDQEHAALQASSNGRTGVDGRRMVAAVKREQSRVGPAGVRAQFEFEATHGRPDLSDDGARLPVHTLHHVPRWRRVRLLESYANQASADHRRRSARRQQHATRTE